MIPFMTEFPVKPNLDRANFVAQVLAWLRGVENSTVLKDWPNTDLDKETAYIQAPNGEELRLREFGKDTGLQAVGFRHDIPDDQGRLWRTEAVLRLCAAADGQHLIRLRTQCIAQRPGARLETPKKPYLVKALLNDELGGKDGELNVGYKPLWLKADETSLQIACNVTYGKANQHMPVIYVSALERSRWLLSAQELGKLAFDLGGVAHVIVEPDRAFSFQLREKSRDANAYGGTLGIALPGQGIVRRLYLGWQIQDGSSLMRALRLAVLGLRGQMPAEGWDWTELQEQALRKQRERDRNRLSTEENEQLYRDEIDNLHDQIEQLKEQLYSRPEIESAYKDPGGVLPGIQIAELGPEIYLGEFSDRLRLSCDEVHRQGDLIGLDSRSKALFEVIATKLRASPELSTLREDLKRATNEPKRVATEVTELLLRHGYRQKSDNKHIRLESREGFLGLGTITVPKTPSDGHGLKNLRKQIERALGLTKLLD